jgi:hypothetical protein
MGTLARPAYRRARVRTGTEQGVNQEKASGFLMGLTYAAGAGGVGWALSTAFSPNPDLRWPCFLAVGIAGILSWIRHSLLNRGDAARMGWDSGTTNPFQVEVGLANLAWGVLAVVAALLSWGLAVYSASFLVFGFYMAFVAAYKARRSAGGHPEEWRTVFPAATFAALLIVVGSAGMSALP